MNFKDIKLIPRLYQDEELKRAFDGWICCFGIRDSIRGLPEYDSLIHSSQFELNRVVKQVVKEALESVKPKFIKEEPDMNLEKLAEAIGYNHCVDKLNENINNYLK